LRARRIDMTETKTKEFAPITSQQEFDEAIKSRLAREREKWSKESGTADLRAELQAKDQEIADLKREHYLDASRRAVVGELAAKGVTDEGRIGRILKHVDLEAIEPDETGQPDRLGVQGQLAAVGKDMPELLTYRVGAGSGGSRQPVLEQEKPLSRDELENMSEQEVNSRWDQVRAFLAGERG
jgi:hypothetical protein